MTPEHMNRVAKLSADSKYTKLDVFYQRPGNIVQQAVVDTWLVPWILRVSPVWYWNQSGSPKVVFRNYIPVQPGSTPPKRYQAAVLLNRLVWLLASVDTNEERNKLSRDLNYLWQNICKFPRIRCLNEEAWDCRLENLSMKMGRRALIERAKNPDKFMHPLDALDKELGRPTRAQVEFERSLENGVFPLSDQEIENDDLRFQAPPPAHRMSADESSDPSVDDVFEMIKRASSSGGSSTGESVDTPKAKNKPSSPPQTIDLTESESSP